MMGSLFSNFTVLPHHLHSLFTLITLTSIVVTVKVFQDLKNDTLVVLSWPRFVRDAFAVMLVTLIVIFREFSSRPFIYFQF